MNQIISGFLREHIKEYEIENFEEKDAFEHFINRCIVTKYTSERFDPADIMTEEGEIGIDGVAIIINKQLVTSLEEAKLIYAQNSSIDVDLIFIQAKRSNSFDGGEMSTFTKGVRHFFEPKEKRPKTNDKMESLIEIKDYIYSRTIDYDKKPSLFLFYVCCGKWNQGNNLTNTVEQDKDLFNETGDFETVEYRTLDNDDIIILYKEMRRKIQKSFVMEKRLPFYSMDGIKEAYFGLVKCKDIADMLADETGRLFSNIFEDNVRDFQGYNPVNSEIQKTIQSNNQQRFAVLNNGITIIAKDIKTEGDNIKIFDYQIVNGCQTSHVLFDNRNLLNDSSYILTKIVRVENEDILDEIVYTSNRQTEVKYEAFTSANKFHKYLQEYYNSVDEKYRLFYERRSKQYDMEPGINKNKIVSLAAQTKDYVAVFLNEPHSTHRYYGEILESYKKRIYGRDDNPEPYYVAAYIYYLVDQLLKNGKIDKQLKNYKYHICYAFRVLLCGQKVVLGNSREIKKMADTMMEVAKDNTLFIRTIDTACSCIKTCLSKEKANKELLPRMSEFTKSLTLELNTYLGKTMESEHLQKGDIVSCQVTAIKEYNVDVTIRTDDKRDKGSIHISQVANRKIWNLADEFSLGQIVQGKLISNYEDFSFGWSISIKELND